MAKVDAIATYRASRDDEGEKLRAIAEHPETATGHFMEDTEAWHRACELWDAAVAARGAEPAVLANAVRFWWTSDTEKARSLIERGERLEPTSSRWPLERAMSWQYDDRFAEAVDAYERALVLATASERREVAMILAHGLIEAERYDRAEQVATELALDATRDQAWHVAQIALGHVALARGEVDEACRRLAASVVDGLGEYSGDLYLAGLLWQQGRRVAVRGYLAALRETVPRAATCFALIESDEDPRLPSRAAERELAARVATIEADDGRLESARDTIAGVVRGVPGVVVAWSGGIAVRQDRGTLPSRYLRILLDGDAFAWLWSSYGAKDPAEKYDGRGGGDLERLLALVRHWFVEDQRWQDVPELDR